MRKLEHVYEHFDQLPDSQKEYFLRKIQEKAIKEKKVLANWISEFWWNICS